MKNKKRLFFLASISIAFVFTAVAYSSTPANASDMRNNTKLARCNDADGIPHLGGIKFYLKDNQTVASIYGPPDNKLIAKVGGAVECLQSSYSAYDDNMLSRWNGSHWLGDIWGVNSWSYGKYTGVESARFKNWNINPSNKYFWLKLWTGVNRTGTKWECQDNLPAKGSAVDIDIPDYMDNEVVAYSLIVEPGSAWIGSCK